MTPDRFSVDSFAEALATYRRKWPKDGYFTFSRRFIESYRFLNSHYSDGTILDIGGWPGDFACVTASLGLPVQVIDKDIDRPIAKEFDKATGSISLQGNTTLRSRCQEYGVTALQCDIERDNIPLESEAVDFIVFTEVIEHLRIGLLHALREIHRILRPGGKLLISTPNLLSLRNRLSFMLGRVDYDTLEMPYDALISEEIVGHGGHFRLFSLPELFDLLSKTGFEVVESSCQQIPWSDAVSEPLSWRRKMLIRFESQLSSNLPGCGNSLFLVLVRK